MNPIADNPTESLGFKRSLDLVSMIGSDAPATELREHLDAAIAAVHKLQAERDQVRDELATRTAELQAESARVDARDGMIAFLAGVLQRTQKTPIGIVDALEFARMAIERLDKWRGGLWSPGPTDDPADWKPTGLDSGSASSASACAQSNHEPVTRASVAKHVLDLAIQHGHAWEVLVRCTSDQEPEPA